MTAGGAAGGRRGSTPADLDAGPVPWPAVAAAIALLARRKCPSVISRADLLAGVPAEQVIAAFEVMTGALIEAISPDDKGASVLQRLGLVAATEAARQLTEGGR